MKRGGIFLLLLAFLCVGQGFGPKIVRGPMPVKIESSFDPSSLNPTNWWVYTDLPTNNFKTNTWTDRISGVRVIQNTAGNQPVNNTNGMWFQNAWFASTNNLSARTVIFTIVQLTNLTDFQYALEWGSSGYGLTKNTGANGFGFTGDPFGNMFSRTPTTNVWIDIVFVTCTSPTNSTYYYTNGVEATHSSGIQSWNDILVVGARRSDGLQPWYGFIKEVLIATNQYSDNGLWVATQLHLYATNRYAYSP